MQFGDFKSMILGEDSESEEFILDEGAESFASVMILDGNYNDYVDNDGSELFTSTISGILGIDQSQINVINVEEGSVIVKYQVLAGDTNLQELKDSLVSSIANNELQFDGYSITDASVGESGQE